ncbi:MAG: hypothetical protein EZS28_040662, partial [Streblomastix strix]
MINADKPKRASRKTLPPSRCWFMTKRKQIVKDVVREMCGLAPYEKRVMEL